MTHDQSDMTDKEEPLDPVLEKVKQRMMRLLLISGGIMAISIFAVLVAIIFKTNHSKPQIHDLFDVQAPLKRVLSLPKGFVPKAVALSGDKIIYSGSMADGTQKSLIFDLKSGRLVAELSLVSAP